jgi:uncharacterized protein YgbK (DUF1537 family)
MIGVIADDITGANDIGVMFAKHGWATAVVAHAAPGALPAADAVVLESGSFGADDFLLLARQHLTSLGQPSSHPP